jgi:hypothetical protein
MKSKISKSMKRLRASLTLLLIIKKKVLTLMTCTTKKFPDADSAGTLLLQDLTLYSLSANAQDLSDIFTLNA